MYNVPELFIQSILFARVSVDTIGGFSTIPDPTVLSILFYFSDLVRLGTRNRTPNSFALLPLVVACGLFVRMRSLPIPYTLTHLLGGHSSSPPRYAGGSREGVQARRKHSTYSGHLGGWLGGLAFFAPRGWPP